MKRPLIVGLGLVLWIGALAWGLRTLWAFSAAPGPAAEAPPLWPEGTPLHRAPDRGALVLFLHPLCPCSRATLAELARALGSGAPADNVHVVFLQPEEPSEAWRESATWEEAGRLPGALRHLDEGSRVARRFGARTSGQALYYDAAGRLRFQGGLTPARGHEGYSPGRATVEALLRGRPGPEGAPVTPVFGCQLGEERGDRVR